MEEGDRAAGRPQDRQHRAALRPDLELLVGRWIVSQLLDALPSGSYLALSDGIDTDQAAQQAEEQYPDTGAVPYALRRPEEIAGYFDGLELVDPGCVPVARWHPDDPVPAGGADLPAFAGVGRKP